MPALRVFIMPGSIISLVFLMRCFIVSSSSCQSDRNQDHRPRVSCVSQALTAVPNGIPTDQTQVLVLTGNRFTSLSWSMYSGFAELHELDLSHNHISTLEPPGPVLEKLSVLRLSGNRLSGLGGLVFRGAPNLTEIYLDRNQIRSLHDGTFSELPHLEVINLSQNKLPALPSHLLERISSGGLKTFDLENNSVSLMPDRFFLSKPELPYVYLSHNPWLCSCAVGYLHSYLNDQEHNVYIHDGPNNHFLAADSVVCSGPPHLFKRPIIELEENDFCPPDPPDLADPSGYHHNPYPKGDQDFGPPHVLLTTSVKPISTTQTLTSPYDTTTDANLPDSTNSWTSVEGYWVTETWIKIWTYFTLTPMASPYLPSQYATEPNTWKTDTSQPTANPEPPTPSPIIAESQSQATDQPEPQTFRKTTAFDTTFGPIIAESQSQATDQPEPETFSKSIAFDTTFGPIIAESQSQATDQPETETFSKSIAFDTTFGPIIGQSQSQATDQPETETFSKSIAFDTTFGPIIAESQSQVTDRPEPQTFSKTTAFDTTFGPIIAESQSQVTDRPEPETFSKSIAFDTTFGPVIAESQSQVTDRPEPQTFSKSIAFDTTFGPIIGQSQHQSTAQPELHTIMLQTEPPTARQVAPQAEPPTSVGPLWSDAQEANGQLLPWCWWLFAGFVLLCVLSALTSCFLFLWLLRNYLVVYRRLKRRVSARSDSGGVALRAYRRTENTHKWENEGESVSFLPLEQIKDAQAVFRSILFISRDEQHQMRGTEVNVSSEIELVRDKEQVAMVSGEVFRKTLCRVISREEEADGWTEEEDHWTNARYSLILKEEKGCQREMQWLVGEWEIGGVACERSCSLIGQPSAVALE